MYLQYEVPTTFNVKIGYIFLDIKDVLSSSILLLEGKNGQEYLKNCTPSYLLIYDSIHLKLVVVPIGLFYFICNQKKNFATTFLYDQCQHWWHIACLILPLLTLP